MNEVLILNKPIGLTPLELINNFRVKHPEYSSEKMAYAGRLDPMAHGKIIILVGEKCKERENFQKLSKRYKVKILLGIATDTYDILGKITSNSLNSLSNFNINKQQLETSLHKYEGQFEQSYPVYSSKTVKGKALYWWARNNRLSEISVPTKKVTIHSIKLVDIQSLTGADLFKLVKTNIAKVAGDFRQPVILRNWERVLSDNGNVHFPIISIDMLVSSGTYARGIANQIGIDLKTYALALDINRTGFIAKSKRNDILFCDSYVC